jgi:hypothetical protein
MENFEEFLPDEDKIEDNKVFETVLMHPKKAFKFIHKYRYENHLKVLLVLGGINNSFDRAVSNNSGDKMELSAVIGFAVIGGALLGWISFYLYAALVSWSGSWLNGKGKTADILRVLAYSLIPSIVTMVLMIFQIVVYGNDYFKSDIDINDKGIVASIIYFGCALGQIGLSIWSLVLFTLGVAEVQKFTFGKAFLNVILPIVIIAVPILVILMVLELF